MLPPETAATASEANMGAREIRAQRVPEAHPPMNLAPALRSAHSVRAAVRARAQLILRPDRWIGRAIDNLILALIVLSVGSVILEAIPGLPAWVRRTFRVEEIIVVAVFSLEYLLRLAAATKIRNFVFSFEGVVDLISIAPFYLAGVDTRAVRALRLLRLLRLLKLQRRVLESTVAERTRELADKNASLEEAQAQLKAELEVARALQIAILPETFPMKPGCDGAARMIPATTMGGDFYDFIELPDGRVGLVMADVCGKGVPAAFFMAVARTNLRDIAPQYPEPGACLAQANERLCAHNPMDLFVSVFYCVFDPTTGKLKYANAGHNPPYVRRTDGSVEALSGAGGLVLGAMPGVQFPDHVAQLRPGDRLVLYTDGISEARLIAQIKAYGDGAAVGLVENICRSVAVFAGAAPQSDDITLTVLKWGAP
jgi:serine phosphatase RsbU (regulator of sigma subunit)